MGRISIHRVQCLCLTLLMIIFFFIFRGPIHRERRNYLRTALKEMSLILSDQPGLLGPKVCNFLKPIELVSLHFLFSQHRPCEILKRNYYPLSFCNLCASTYKNCACVEGEISKELFHWRHAESPSGLEARLEIWRSWVQVLPWRPWPGCSETD